MSEEIFDKVMTILDLVPDGNFLLSCAFEPTIHPEFIGLLRRIPMEYKKKVAFTTNLARKNLSDELIEEVSSSGIHHINISLDTLNPRLYEELRRGARYDAFIENLERLTKAFRRNVNAPLIRYITVVSKANMDEVPDIIERCSTLYLSHENEIRYFWIHEHHDKEWIKNNAVTYAEWKLLEERIAKLPYKYFIATTPGLTPNDSSRNLSEYEMFIANIQDLRKFAVHNLISPPDALFIRSNGMVEIFGTDIHFDLNNIESPYDFFSNLVEILALSVDRANELKVFVEETLKIRGEKRELLKEVENLRNENNEFLNEMDTPSYKLYVKLRRNRLLRTIYAFAIKPFLKNGPCRNN
jgi:hypothetical protein